MFCFFLLSHLIKSADDQTATPTPTPDDLYEPDYTVAIVFSVVILVTMCVIAVLYYKCIYKKEKEEPDKLAEEFIKEEEQDTVF